jgi:predicted aldo/keto reductase-like oxidoreductase
MPTRILGKTGVRVSILAFGSGSRWLMYKEEDKALEAMSKALDLGISYVDTAYGYGNGESERRVGKLMPQRRKTIFLATKLNVRNGDKAMEMFEGSLKRLQTDHVDLVHIHSLTGPEDLAAIEAPDGVLKVLYKLRDQKVARHIGITSHTDPAVLKTALERHDFDCTQMALNAARAGMAKGISALGESHPDSFESLALPVANRKKMGVIAMKIFAQEGLNGKAPVEKLIRYALSLPVTAAVLGMPKLEYIEENIQVAKAFKPLPAAEMKTLSNQLAGQHKAALDRFFASHVDA